MQMKMMVIRKRRHMETVRQIIKVVIVTEELTCVGWACSAMNGKRDTRNHFEVSL